MLSKIIFTELQLTKRDKTLASCWNDSQTSAIQYLSYLFSQAI